MQPTTHQEVMQSTTRTCWICGEASEQDPCPECLALSTATADKPMSEDEIAAAEAADLLDYRGM